MYHYFAINIVFSLLVFLYLDLLKTAPFRVRFRIVMIGLISWLLPYDLINSYLTQGQSFVISSTVSNFNGAIKNAIASQVENNTLMTLLNIMVALMVIGLLWFLRDITALKSNIKKLSLQSTLFKNEKNVAIYIVKNSDCVFSTGLTSPKIYIAEKHMSSPYIESIIEHEIQHITTNDQFWLLLITLIQRLFWWNPLIYVLAIKGRELLELSCDEACNKQKQGNKYQHDLAQLLVQNHRKSNPLASHFFGKSKLNIYRIKQLSKEFKMNTKNKALIFSTAIIPFIILLLISTASVSSNKTAIDKKGQPVVLAIDEVDITLKVLLTITNEWDKNIGDITGETTFSNTQSIKSRMITKFDQKLKLQSSLKIEVVPKKINDDQIFIETEITYFIGDEKIIQNPSLLILNNNESSIIIEGENHTLELIVLPRF